MIWEKNVKLIIMACELTEGQSKKCYYYWPKLSTTFFSNDLKLKNGYKISAISEKNISNNLTERIFSITNSNEKKEIKQLHFRKWPDHGVPDLVQTFETFENINEIIYQHYETYKSESPVVVHCSAGVGRTGTVISIYQIFYIEKKYLEKNLRKFDLNIFNIARRLKEQRRYMIQTSAQYELVYKFSYIFLKKLSLSLKK